MSDRHPGPHTAEEWCAICDSYAAENQRLSNELDRLRAEVTKLRALIQRCVDDDIDSGCFRKATYEACVAALEAPAPPGKEE